MKNTFQLPDHRVEQKRTKGQTNYEKFVLNPQNIYLGTNKKYLLRTFGCQANVRDSESLSGILEMMGFTATDSYDDADFILFNTCAVRKNAEDKVFGEIGHLKHLKKAKPNVLIGLCGCMAQEEEIVKFVLHSYPQVDIIFGTHNIHRLPHLLAKCIEEKSRQVEVYSCEGDVVEDIPVARSMEAKGFVNIMYGCDKFCTYCIVPYTRGKQRSRKMEDILQEVNELKASGRKEVVLLGQNVNAYGKDLGMEDGFTKLLIEVAKTGIERIRFYTSHPRDYSATTIDAMVEYPNIMPYLHLPVQSGSNAILKKMARGYTIEQYKALFDQMKQKIDRICFTTDIIVGFPSETKEDFQATLDLVEYCQFDSAFTFIYSKRAGTPAEIMKDDISEEEKKERLAILNEKIEENALKNNLKYENTIVKVLCEGMSKRNQQVYSGYTEENKLVNFTSPYDVVNQIVSIKITKAHAFSLDGELVEQSQ